METTTVQTSTQTRPDDYETAARMARFLVAEEAMANPVWARAAILLASAAGVVFWAGAGIWAFA